MKKKYHKKRVGISAVSAGIVAVAALCGTESLAAFEIRSSGCIVLEENKLRLDAADIVELDDCLLLLRERLLDGEDHVTQSDREVFSSFEDCQTQVQSCGSINCEDGRAVADAADVLALADGIDELADRYTADVCGALADIGTYIDGAGNAGHLSPSADPVSLDSGQLAAAVLFSQSVEDLSVAAAAADNLTAGTAAWIDGVCIRGTGADNDRAYQQGMEDGLAGEGQDIEIHYTYHTHVRGSGEEEQPCNSALLVTTTPPGGCYVLRSGSPHVHSGCPGGMKPCCGVHWVEPFEHSQGYWLSNCGIVNPNNMWDGQHHNMVYNCGGKPDNAFVLGCGRVEGEIESALVVMNGVSAEGDDPTAAIALTELTADGSGSGDGAGDGVRGDTADADGDDGAADGTGGSRRDALRSCGAVVYGDGSIVLDSADLYMLADRMDEFEQQYGGDVCGALVQIGTEVGKDGSILAGILQSQSVAHLQAVQASAGAVPLYYRMEPNHLLEVTGEDTGMPVLIRPASADNLTAGTAAWVDGKCVMGNGEDSRYFYQKGFIEGLAQKVGADVEYQYDDSGKVCSATLLYP